MKILYAVQATGNGHITRARVMAKAFAKLQTEFPDFSVHWLFSGREKDELFEMDEFGDFSVAKGLSFTISNGKINPLKTLSQNSISHFLKEVKQLRLNDYDLLINDFEPVSAWAAKNQDIDSIGISHQMAFQWPIPTIGGHFFARQLLKYFAPVRQVVGIHWDHFDAPIMPPVVETIAATQQQKVHPLMRDRNILVYYPFIPLAQLLALFCHFPEYQFHIFHPVEKEQQLGNVTVYPLGREKFQYLQQQCCGVITAAGFELPSEAIILGQKLLIIPVAGQFEQECNALALQQMGRATVTSKPERSILQQWLQQPAFHPKPMPDVGYELAKWIVSGREESLESLSRRLWQRDTAEDEVMEIDNSDQTVTSCLT